MTATPEAAEGPTFFSELIRRRYRYRQFVGIALAVVLVAFAEPVRTWVVTGAILAVMGAAVRLWASGHVKKNTELATTGPYAYVRHPLYVGNHLIAIGLCLASGLWWAFPLWLAQALVFYPAAVRREDSRLEDSFGESWRAWRAETHALVPRATPYRPAGATGAPEKGTWSFRQSLMANGEPIYVAVIAAMFVWLWTQG